MNSDAEKVHKFKFPKSFETIKGDLEKIPNKFYNCALYHGFTKKDGDVINMWEIQWSLSRMSMVFVISILLIVFFVSKCFPNKSSLEKISTS